MRTFRLAGALSLPLWLGACALGSPPASVPATPPPQWYAPAPHNGAAVNLTAWWSQFDDPLLVQLIEAAQAASPTIATAKSRIEQARATRTAAGAALLPTLDGSLTAQRGNNQPPAPLATSVQASLQTAWEIDIFGVNRGTANAAQSRFDGAQAGWHDARVAVAAETANLYYNQRTCERQLAVTRGDAASRAETSRLSALSTKAGFTAPASDALARASAAEASARATQQRALCDIDVKALVALTAVPEPDLRSKLAAAPNNPAPAAAVTVASVPAQLLAQRPDVYVAEREVAAASAEVGSALADRYPRLRLNGSVGVGKFRSGGVTGDLDTWAIGPVALTLPLFDGGRRAANVDAAQARYEEAAAAYRGRVRQAVREVEEALVNLESTASRADDAKIATDGYRASFTATEARYRGGLASLVELEDARRTALAAETALVTLQRERIAAWIALYRAAGGGWSAPSTSTAAAQP
jgi:multidrug efflux system outer membrane protein